MNERRQRRASDRKRSRANRRMATLAAAVTRWTGSSSGFSAALAIIALWAVTGPLFHWSDTWQLVINTGTTIVTFLMVFLVQRTQNKDGLAIQLKLNELVAAMRGASNRLISVEELPEEELKVFRAHYLRLVQLARADDNVTSCHSVEEAEQRHATSAVLPIER